MQNGKTEKEISRLIIDLLQKAPTRKVAQNKIATPNTSQMLDLLGIKKEGE